eukprot:11547619-Prorocentrum_lima.AAC.1
MTSSLVGSEMCIRDSLCCCCPRTSPPTRPTNSLGHLTRTPCPTAPAFLLPCLLYTSDAADDM